MHMGKLIAISLAACIFVFSERGAKAQIMVADYPMNEPGWGGPAPQVIDATGNGHSGTAIGGATTAADPVFEQAGSFNGNGQYVTVGGSYSMSGARSITAWVDPASNQNYLGLPIVTGGSSTAGDFFGISGAGGENSNLPQYELYVDHWNYSAYHSNSFVTPGAWNQVVMTYDGNGNVAFYINGQSAGSNSGNLYSYDFSSYVIGGNTIGGTTTQQSFQGLMHNVEIYDYAMSAGQVASLYGSESPGPQPTWTISAGGSWNTSGNWSTNSVPNGAGQRAVLGAGPASAATITLDAAQTIGALTLNNSAGYTIVAGNSGSLTIDNTGGAGGGHILVLSGSHSIAAPLVLANNGATVTLSGNGSLTISGNISESGGSQSLTLGGDGSGVLVLSGSNSYSGSTAINAGTLVAARAASLPGYNANGAVTVGSGALLGLRSGDGISGWNSGQIDAVLANATFADNTAGIGIDTASGSFTYGGSITQPIALTKLGPNLLTLTGSNSYSGLTTVSGGTLQLGDGSPGHDGISLSSSILNNAALVFNLNGFQSYSGAISGNGSLTKTGPGTLVLSSQSAYAGPTAIKAGTLMSGSGLQFSTAVISAGTTTTVGSFSYSSGPLAQGELAIVGHGNNFWGPIQSGQFVYTTVPTNKPFDVAVHIASLVTDDGDGWAESGIMARADAGNKVVATIFSAQTSGNGVSFEADDQELGYTYGGGAPNWLRLTYDGQGNFQGYFYNGASATVPAASDPNWTAVSPAPYNDPMPSPTIALGIADTANYDNFTNTSFFDNLGTLLPLFPLGPASNVLPLKTALSIARGGTFDLAGGDQQVASLSDYAPGSGGSVINSNTAAASVLTLSPSGGSSTFSGAILGGGTLGAISLVMSGSGTQVLTGLMTGPGSLAVDSGELILSGSDSYTGGTTVNAGTLVAAYAYALPDGTSLTVGAGGTFIFDPSQSASAVAVLPGAVGVPEPSTLALLGVAVLGMSMRFVRRKRDPWRAGRCGREINRRYATKKGCCTSRSVG
ncbi:MAG: autotransporter-associated beta strand repeat-containing protein [Thermoguttaceae bacterium]